MQGMPRASPQFLDLESVRYLHDCEEEERKAIVSSRLMMLVCHGVDYLSFQPECRVAVLYARRFPIALHGNSSEDAEERGDSSTALLRHLRENPY
mmetsp:Transcript_15408/g.36347  ORF Transcript_15408/g.36347 Transcript_15408/m.36347 type:complete len:95 (+) Transcript_15408:235-519(+)